MSQQNPTVDSDPTSAEQIEKARKLREHARSSLLMCGAVSLGLLLLGSVFATLLLEGFCNLQHDPTLQVFFVDKGGYLARLVAVECFLLLPILCVMLVVLHNFRARHIDWRIAVAKASRSAENGNESVQDRLKRILRELQRCLAGIYAAEPQERDRLMNMVDRGLQLVSDLTDKKSTALAKAISEIDKLVNLLETARIVGETRPSHQMRLLLGVLVHIIAFTTVCAACALWLKPQGELLLSITLLPVLGIPVVVPLWGWLGSFLSLLFAWTASIHRNMPFSMSAAAQLSRILLGVGMASIVYFAMRIGGVYFFAAVGTDGSAAKVELRPETVVLCSALVGMLEQLWEPQLVKLARHFFPAPGGNDDKKPPAPGPSSPAPPTSMLVPPGPV